MMNRDRITRGRTATRSSATTFGLSEQLERVSLYLINLLASILALFSWLLPFGWLVSLVVFFIEKNRNVRWHALQSAVVFGSLSIVYMLVVFLKWLLGGIWVLGFFTSLGLGLLASVIVWVMILMAVWLTVMAFFRPGYRLPFVGRMIEGTFGRWT